MDQQLENKMAYVGIMRDVKRQIINEVYKPAQHNFQRRRTIIKKYVNFWQADLLEVQTYANQNSDHRYILVVIDCYCKYVWSEPIKNKTSEKVPKAFKNILKNAEYTPKNLQTDNRTGFYNQTFSRLMVRYNINHYSTFST